MQVFRSIFWDQTNSDVLVYRFPFNNISLGSVLTVQEGQEALFYKSGVLYDSFSPGRYTLSSANLPLLDRIINLPTNGVTTFLAVVYFINKTVEREIFWGAGGLRVFDPFFQIPIKMSARGQYGIRISDGSLFLKKFAGSSLLIKTETIEEQFNSEVVELIKVTISKFMKESGININEIGTEYKKLSGIIFTELNVIFEEYGVELVNFNIEDISFDESDEGYQKVMDAIAEKKKLEFLGTNYLQNRQIDIAQTAAANNGIGLFTNAGLGVGIGQNLSKAINNTIVGMETPPPPPPSHILYYIGDNGKTTGPFGIDDIEQKILSGEVTENSYICIKGTREWKHLIDIKELSDILPPPPPLP